MPISPRWLLSFVFLFTAPFAISAEVEPFDTWYVLQLEGQKAGYMHMQLTREGDNWVTATTMKMSVSRGAAAIEIQQQSRFVESAQFEPIEATSSLKAATMTQDKHILFGDEQWEVTEKSFGGDKTTTIDAPEQDWLTPVALYLETERAIAEGKEQITVTTLDISVGLQPMTMTLKKVEEGEVEVFGKVVPATKWSTEMSLLPGIDTAQWVDEQGRVVRQSIALLPGMEMTMLLADKQLAMAKFDAPEMLAASLITPNKPIDNPRDLNKATYNLSMPGLKQKLNQVPESAAMQTAKWVDDNTLQITIDLTGQPVASEKPDVDYLKATAVLDSDDPEIIALSMQSQRALEEAQIIEQAEAVRSFVREFIDEKNLSVGFATASEVARTAEGDCSEHACLTAAMLRAAGIPSRTVTGLVYADQFAGREGVFGFHMWAQAYIPDGKGGGYWLDLDAAAPGNINAFDATHIALTYSSMAGDAMSNEMVEILPLMQGIEIEVVEAE